MKRKRVSRIILCMTLCAALLLGGVPAQAATTLAEQVELAAQALQVPQEAELSAEYLQYLESADAGAARIPTTVDIPAATVEQQDVKGSGVLPASVDLRQQGLVPEAIYDQGSEATCWSIAIATAAEVAARRQGLSTDEFSATHIKYATSADGGNTWGHDRSYYGAGNEYISTAYLLRGSGLVSREDDPETTMGGVRPAEETNSKQPVYNVKTVRWFSDVSKDATEEEQQAFRANRIQETKKLLAEGNAVTCEIYYSKNYEHDNGNTVAYYSLAVGSSGIQANHEVVLVGYDDTYSKDNFNSWYSPETDGAFLVRNSKGESSGKNGYFYLSYEDLFAAGATAVIYNLDELGEFDTTYQYDPLGMTKYLSYKTASASLANLFDLNCEGELLGAVSFASLNAGATYKVLLANGLSADVTNLDGVEFTEISSGSLENPGYYTLPVPEVVLTGDKYALQIQITATDGQPGYIAVEMPVAGFSSKNATAQVGQSFVAGPGGIFTDLASIAAYANTNVCLKGHTKAGVEMTIDLAENLAYGIQPRVEALAVADAIAARLSGLGLGQVDSVTLSAGDVVVTEGYAATGMVATAQLASGQTRALTLSVLGDVALGSNGCGDGTVKSMDALTALRISVGDVLPTAAQFKAADLDGSGRVTSFEALRILRYSVGDIQEF